MVRKLKIFAIKVRRVRRIFNEKKYNRNTFNDARLTKVFPPVTFSRERTGHAQALDVGIRVKKKNNV